MSPSTLTSLSLSLSPQLFVGWLYSKALRYPTSEKEIGPLLDLYFLSQQLEIARLSEEVVETLRTFYHTNETYPSLRRVQYVYSNTSQDNEMREMMVGAVARYLTLSDAIPTHWETALKKNGQLSVDIIRSIQQWHLQGASVPDVRDLSQERGREKVGFSDVVEGETQVSGYTGKMPGGVKQEEDESEVGVGANGHGA